jgi:hypothetical protein
MTVAKDWRNMISFTRPMLLVINKTTGDIERQFESPSNDTHGVHREYRRARLTQAETILVAHLDLGKIVWALRSWTPPTDLGQASTIQILDKPSDAAKIDTKRFLSEKDTRSAQ